MTGSRIRGGIGFSRGRVRASEPGEKTNPTPVDGSEIREQPEQPSAPGSSDSGEQTQPDEHEHELSIDRVFELLKNSRRRETLKYLDNHGEKVTLSEVAEHIAAIENDTTPRAITSQQRKRVYVGLYQSHLPKMDDAAVIEFEKNRGTIRRGPNAAQLEPYLTVPDTRQWHRLYLAVAIVSSLLLLAAWSGLGAIRLTPVGAVVFSLVGLTLAMGTQLAADRR